MPGQGTSLINFGAFPGSVEATVAVTGQTGIVATSLVEAWVLPANTADHSIDEHIIDPPRVIAANITPGTGFTIYGFASAANSEGQYALDWGNWNVAWVWN